MPRLQQCKIQGCSRPLGWRILGAGDYLVGYLCSYHKEQWYDKNTNHTSHLVAITESEEANEMAAQPTKSGQHENRDLARTTHPHVGVAGRGSVANRVEGGQRDDNTLPATQPEGSGRETAVVQLGAATATALSAQAQAGQLGALGLSPDEITILRAAPDPLSIEIRPDGIVYTPWTIVASRFDDAFGVGEWALVPEGKPQMVDSFVCWQFHLFVRGKWCAVAIGEHPDPGNQRMSLANRAEAAKSDALVKCSKSLGVFRELWDVSYRNDWIEEYAIRVWAKQSQWSQRYNWLWRRKDRPPFADEKHPDRSGESEYDKRRDYKDDARDHLDAIKKGE